MDLPGHRGAELGPRGHSRAFQTKYGRLVEDFYDGKGEGILLDDSEDEANEDFDRDYITGEEPGQSAGSAGHDIDYGCEDLENFASDLSGNNRRMSHTDLLVEHLPTGMSVAEMKAVFSPYGSIGSIKKLPDAHGKVSLARF